MTSQLYMLLYSMYQQLPTTSVYTVYTRKFLRNLVWQCASLQLYVNFGCNILKSDSTYTELLCQSFIHCVSSFLILSLAHSSSDRKLVLLWLTRRNYRKSKFVVRRKCLSVISIHMKKIINFSLRDNKYNMNKWSCIYIYIYMNSLNRRRCLFVSLFLLF